MSAQSLIIGSCILWVIVCARLWWSVGNRNTWQRHLIAIGAGLGAALIYVFGQMMNSALAARPVLPATPASGEDIRVSPVTPKK